MKTKVYDYIDKNNMLQDGDTVIIGVSGGQDSICLLFLLLEYSKKINIEVVHINHMIRQSADKDAAFVKNICERMGIRCHIFSYDVEKLSKEERISTEEAGRKVRYQSFEKVLGDRNGKIAIAHNANDQAETMLFNLFRGTGIRGLTGISPVNGKIIRPLLSVTRSEIEKYIKDNGYEYVTDETNLTDIYTRNKIRHNILEYAEKEVVHGTVNNMLRASEQLTLINSFLDESVGEALKRCCVNKKSDEIILNVDDLLSENVYIAKRIIYDSISEISGTKKDITNIHIDDVYDLLVKDGSKKLSLPYNLCAVKEYKTITLCLDRDINTNQIDVGSIDFKEQILSEYNMSDIPSDAYTKWFDYDKISNAYSFRTRQKGDFLTINSKMDKKSLKDYMIDAKIPKDQRDNILVLADGSHIMWVVGYRISEYYKVTDKTNKVLEIEINQ